MFGLPLESPIIHHPRQLPTPVCRRWKRISCRPVWARSKPKDDDVENDPFFQAATRAAFLRLQDTRRSDPLIHDTYVGCLVSSFPLMNMNQKPTTTCYYHLATKFIDDKLLGMMNESDDLRQIVLLTDGMDTRPYRLNWPRSTLIFDISPGKVFRRASERLRGHGAKVPRGCMFIHIPRECPDIVEVLHGKGYRGNRPSIWVLQGLPIITFKSLMELLYTVSCLAMKNSVFLGEMPIYLLGADLASKSNLQKQMDKIFISNGFRVDTISFEEVAECYNRNLLSEKYGNALFVAEQLQLSDDQMESWRKEFQRMENEGDEEGFEDW